MEPIALFLIAGAFAAFGLLSSKASKTIVTGPMVFAGVGFLLSAPMLGVFDGSLEFPVAEALASIALVVTLFDDAAGTDVKRLRREASVPVRMLAIGLPLTALLGGALALLIFPELTLWEAAVLAVILSPTDAALGQAVITNDAVPERIRQALNVESGLNDGIAFPALLIVASLAADLHDRDTTEWGLFVAGQLLLGPAIGVLSAVLATRIIKPALRRGWMEETYLNIVVLMLPLLAYAGAELVGGNGFIAAFACGVTVAFRSDKVREEVERFGEAQAQLATLLVFLIFGGILMPQLLTAVSWRETLYAVLALTVMRMLPVAISLTGTGFHVRTKLFLGWFGPRGLASIIYLLLVTERFDLADIGVIERTVALTILISIVAHGVTAAPLARRYGAFVSRRGGRHAEDRSPNAGGPKGRRALAHP